MATNNALNISTAGIQAYNGAGTFSARTLTGTANQVAIANGVGDADPTYSLTSSIYVSGISFDAGTTTLSAYSTGTFVPVTSSTGGAPTVSYTVQLGRYTRIGNRVNINTQLSISSYTGGSGSCTYGNLPFTNKNATSNNLVTNVHIQSIVLTTFFGVFTNFGPNTTFCTFLAEKTALAFGIFGPASFAGISQMNFTFQYEV